MKFSLLTVTYGGLFYDGRALTVEEQIHKARQLGFDGLSIETKRPVASPLDLSKEERTRIKKVAADEGIELVALESMSNFCSDIMEERENNLSMMRHVLELARDIDVGMVKIFAAWPGVDNDETPAKYGPYDRGNYFNPVDVHDLKLWHRAVEGIREVADWATGMGIILALQNHGPVLRPGYEDVLAMTEQVNRSNIKICLDVPMFEERQQTEYVREAVEKCSEYICYSHFGAWNFAESPDGEVILEPAPRHGGRINYEAFIEALYKCGYDGYLTSEYCLPIVRDHKLCGIDEIDEATRRALRYMKGLVQKFAPKKSSVSESTIV
ncbi:MAG TPA: sugar phosphate isomerase/epimerase family protein [Chitinophagaceae bacterium]|nr:sugar phosphate isomerase/epimerase family protein [Chitinophagaceae bacterium]